MRVFPIVACVALVSCEDPLIDPFVTGKHFTVYGYLNAFDQDHSLRVIAVRRSPEAIDRPVSPQAEIDADVSTTDLTSNVTIRWTHNLVQLDDGTYGHVFTSRFVVRQGHRYRLVVQRSDGAESTAETEVPNLSQPIVSPAVITPDSVTQDLTWPEAGVPERIEIAYCAKPVGSFSCNDIVINYGRAGRRTESGWVVPVALGRDLLFVRQQLGVASSLILELSSVEMRFTSLDKNWNAPTGDFDPDVFAQPSALTNVENGFGFWGAVARSIHAWMPDERALSAFGYVPPT